jgi:hypothetical protein
MNRYIRFFSEDEDNLLSNEDKLKQEQEAKELAEYESAVEQLQNNTFRNREMRIEFAKIVMNLASSNNVSAKKLVWKMAEFAKYWENDEMIDEDEWRKLNNTNNITEE